LANRNHLTVFNFNSVQWQWRLRRWQRNLRGLFRGDLQQAGISVTGTLIFANLVLFTLMIAQGILAGQKPAIIMNPDTYLLLHAWSQYWPLVLIEGQWWRCLTYAFAHGGIIHLGFNMVVLYQVGPLLENQIGKARFIFLYTFTALTATALGYFWHPMAPVVGASGSLFGLIGFSVVHYHRLGPQGVQIRNFMLQWAIFAFVFGLLVGADNAGHLGGAIGGAVLGSLIPVSWRRRPLLDKAFNVFAMLSTAAIVCSLAMMILSWLSNGTR
jgi:rhomboid protease GluP